MEESLKESNDRPIIFTSYCHSELFGTMHLGTFFNKRCAFNACINLLNDLEADFIEEEVGAELEETGEYSFFIGCGDCGDYIFIGISDKYFEEILEEFESEDEEEEI
jgi:hypothetical protein